MIIWTEERLDRIDRLLPPPPPPAASYVPVREAGGFLYVAGQTPHVRGELSHRGIVGSGTDISATAGTSGNPEPSGNPTSFISPEIARELSRGAVLNSLAAVGVASLPDGAPVEISLIAYRRS